MHYYLLQTVMSKSGKFLKELLLHWKLLHYLRNHKGADRGGKVGTFLCEMYTQIQGNETCTLQYSADESTGNYLQKLAILQRTIRSLMWPYYTPVYPGGVSWSIRWKLNGDRVVLYKH